MKIKEATKEYEKWLGRRMPLIAADLRLKHQRMAESPFPFLRATFYRWSQLWRRLCPELDSAPRVLGVGDLHVENFGTWRDSEGRLVWGINDFDEACRLPYTNDLVRLAVSAQLAVKENRLPCSLAEICQSLSAGYCEALKAGGKPFILAEHHSWLRQVANTELREPVHFWDKLTSWPKAKAAPKEVATSLSRALPERLPFHVVHRQAGLGSLGRRRFTALAQWCGGLVAREAKELTTSAWEWDTKAKEQSVLYMELIGKAVRMTDPCVEMHGRWVVRRLAPDCSRIELASLPKASDELRLLRAMGAETANIHLGSGAAVRAVAKDLKKRNGTWLSKSADEMTKATLADWEEWRR